jgi:hypothetical protein
VMRTGPWRSRCRRTRFGCPRQARVVEIKATHPGLPELSQAWDSANKALGELAGRARARPSLAGAVPALEAAPGTPRRARCRARALPGSPEPSREWGSSTGLWRTQGRDRTSLGRRGCPKRAHPGSRQLAQARAIRRANDLHCRTGVPPATHNRGASRSTHWVARSRPSRANRAGADTSLQDAGDHRGVGC